MHPPRTRGGSLAARRTPHTSVHAEDMAMICEGLLINGVDHQTAWRAHLRELTTARQMVEQHGAPRAQDTREQAEERRGRRRAALARIQEEHQAWLRAHGLAPQP